MCLKVVWSSPAVQSDLTAYSRLDTEDGQDQRVNGSILTFYDDDEETAGRMIYQHGVPWTTLTAQVHAYDIVQDWLDAVIADPEWREDWVAYGL